MRHRRIVGKGIAIDIGYPSTPHRPRRARIERLGHGHQAGHLVGRIQAERRQKLLGLADEEGVNKRRQRFGMGGHGTAAQNQRRVVGTVGRAQGHAGKIQDVEHPGEVQLVLQGKAHHVESLQRARALQREQRQATVAQLCLHVDPRRKHALAGNAGRLVEQRVEDLAAQMGHPDLVGIWKSQAHPRPHCAGMLADLVVFTAYVARRLLDLNQKVRVRVAGARVDHRGLSPLHDEREAGRVLLHIGGEVPVPNGVLDAILDDQEVRRTVNLHILHNARCPD